VSNDNVFKLVQPGAFDDQLTAILRQGARTLLAQAVEAEIADFPAKHAGLKTEDGRQRVVSGTFPIIPSGETWGNTAFGQQHQPSH
jgi:hypothetical protein